MAYETCDSVNASIYGPSLVNICSATTLLAFISTLQSAIEKNDVITGACERVKPDEMPDDEYDFIVIGGGAAGSVLASRLSENSKYKVLLLEAGPDEPAGSGIPGFAGEFLNTDNIWNYTTTNESVACRSRNGSCPCASGKNLGGNSAHGAMVYVRGYPTDFNRWAATGNEGWTWDDVLPFYKKSEDNGEIERVGTKNHGTGGSLPIERFPYVTPIGLTFLQAAKEVGYGVTEDLNDRDNFTGFSWAQATVRKGVGSSTAKAFLRPVRMRKNLHISLNSHVTRIILENKKAVGVEYYKHDKLQRVCVTKEVILSGGAVSSPQILLLSGIGPKNHLKSVKVPVVLDLPGVGQNFHDHPLNELTFTMDDPDTYGTNEKIAMEYVKNQTGPMSATGDVSVLGVLATDMTTPDYPDTQIHIQGYKTGCQLGSLRSEEKPQFIIGVSHLQTRSKGKVTLASNDPFDYPTLTAEYFKDPKDLEAQVKGLQMGLHLTRAEVLKSYNFTMVPVEACSHKDLYSDEYFTCLSLQGTSDYLYHFVGSCKMGPASDRLAVVDPQLRVHGIEGLRVADASIMPQITASNTLAPTIMIGERAADFIKKYWFKRNSLNYPKRRCVRRNCLTDFRKH